MESHPSEAQLVFALEQLDQSLARCVNDELPFEDFCTAHTEYYWSYALDGHELDASGRAMLAKYGPRIARYEAISNILSRICQDADATRESYIKAGRISSSEALQQVRQLVWDLRGEA